VTTEEEHNLVTIRLREYFIDKFRFDSVIVACAEPFGFLFNFLVLLKFFGMILEISFKFDRIMSARVLVIYHKNFRLDT
jgi:hypothetical protein